MANVINTIDWLTLESLRTLKNKLEVASKFNTDENKWYQQKFPVGETIRIKLPQRWVPVDGISYSSQAINRKFTTATVDQFVQIGFDYDSTEKALSLERTKEEIFREYFQPGIEQIAQEIDSRAANFAWQNTNHIVGALGTDPTTVAPFHQARQKLVENAGMTGPACVVVAPRVNSTLGANLTNLFRPGDEIDRLWKRGYLGQLADADWYENMSLYSATAGTWAAAVTVNGASQSGSVLTITATAGDTFNVGDVISIAGVFEVNPVTRRSTGSLKQFAVSQALTAVAGSNQLHIQPAIVGPDAGPVPDQYQNVDSLPANGAALTLYPGTTSPNGKSGIQNMYMTRDAFALVAVELETPKAVEFASQKRDPETGISVRITRTWDPILSRFVNRIDTLFGFGLLYPDNCACRIASA